MVSFSSLRVRRAAMVFVAGVMLVGLGSSSWAATTKSKRPEDVEARIKSLHSQLHITSAQEELWNNVAQTIRENAQTMRDIRDQRMQNTESVNAIDGLKSYAAAVEAHANGIQKFIPTFQALYDSMSDSQKKTADKIFRERARQGMQKSR